MKTPQNFNFESYLSKRVKLIERTIKTALRTHTKNLPPKLREAMEYALLSGGKRIRPVLCLAACEAMGGRTKDALSAALAAEVLHTYTLVHDDLPCMDDDDFRRGKPTVHRKYGEAEAVLVGDALQALAFRLLLDVPQSALSISQLFLGDGAMNVIGGQWEDVCSNGILPLTKKNNGKTAAATIAYVHQFKTAELLMRSAAMGVFCAGKTLRQAHPIASYANHLGLAFQIIDDILDEPERKAKPKTEREMSCLDVWTMAQAQQKAEEHTQAALKELRKIKGNTEPLKALVGFLLKRKI